ncbi:MAG: hypothetical protein J5846_09500 [Desulfovibrio sp.]|nr:hypothetical protein [Desulfovibrio sp.]
MSEQDVIEEMRKNPGGLGAGLTDAQKMRIFLGAKNEPENREPFNDDNFSRGLETAFKNHPIEWLEMK